MESGVVDTGVLIAAANRGDGRHNECVELLGRADMRLVVPALCVAEACHLIAQRIGPHAEAAFLRGLEGFDIRAPEPDDWPRMADLVDQYANFPLGGADASVIALAERLGTEIVLTLDRRHFGAVRPRHCERFQLLPAI